MRLAVLRDHPLKTYAKVFEILSFSSPDTHAYMCLSVNKKCCFCKEFCVHSKSMIPKVGNHEFMQKANTRSKLTIETLEQDVKYVQSLQ